SAGSNSSSSSSAFRFRGQRGRSRPSPRRPAIIIRLAELRFRSMTTVRDVALDASRRSVARWAPLPVRLMVGVGFMQHGVAKLSRGPDAFVTILHALGVPAPHLMAWLTILVELLGGLAVLLGAFVALASVPMAVLLSVAIFTVHLPYG